MFRRILFPTDGSPTALQAADTIMGLVNPQEPMEVTVAIVISPHDASEGDYRPEFLERHTAWLRQEAQRLADRAAAKLQAPGIQCTTKILEGHPVSAILAKEAEQGQYELIVMSSRGLGHQQDSLHYLGSVAERLIRRVSIPVLVVPVSAEEDD